MQKNVLIPAALATLALIATPAFAGSGKHKNKRYDGPLVIYDCPPGLARKNPPCVPPGQARKRWGEYHPRYRIGDIIYRDYRVIRDRHRYGLPRDGLYYLVGREVFRISPETGRVLAFIGLADALLN
ncbi:hypothetical protein AB2B41_08670 [Marimonas sp. MJW-29]|uniref:Excinuclease ABC subunit A n=1 Tax=Sulfitobacter sediminis TaxID=3234186 RepID=A0ABV3RMU3_9RHOB